MNSAPLLRKYTNMTGVLIKCDQKSMFKKELPKRLLPPFLRYHIKGMIPL